MGGRQGGLVRVVAFRGRSARGRVRCLLRRPFHGRVRRHPHSCTPAGDPARPERRLLDGGHGRSRRGRGVLGGDRRDRRHGRRGAHHLHELLCRPQSLRREPWRLCLHLLQRPGGAGVGARHGQRGPPGGAGPLLPRPASRTQHRLPDGLHGRGHARSRIRAGSSAASRTSTSSRPRSCSGRAIARCISGSAWRMSRRSGRPTRKAW